jgi:aminoglycoside phosphotransferase (APT) family kinase protein
MTVRRADCSVAELPPTARSLLTRLISVPPDAVHDVDYLPAGYSNTNYRVRFADEDLVLRIVDPERVTPGIDREREHSLVTGAARALAPPLVAYSLPEGHMLTRWVEGPRLDESKPSVAALAAFLVRIQRTVRTLPNEYRLDEVLGRYAREAIARGARLPGAVERALERTHPHSGQFVACHNDLNPWNVIVPSVAPGSWVTLDWEFAGMGDPWFELSVLAYGLRLDESDHAALIDAYSAVSGVPAPDATGRVELLRSFLLREFLWAQLQAVMGNDRPEVAGQLEQAAARLSELG